MDKILFSVMSYVYKVCNPTILNLSINLKKRSLGLLDYRPKLFIYVESFRFIIICVFFCY